MTSSTTPPAFRHWIGTWNVDPARSKVVIGCRTLWGLSTVKGTFSDLTGICEVAEAGASGEVRIPVATLSTGIGKRDGHLREPEFFGVARFPDITVAVTAAEPRGSDAAGLHATLTIKGITRPIDPTAIVAQLPDGAVQVTTTMVIDRHDFGVDGNLLGMVGHEATASADLVFVRSDRT